MKKVLGITLIIIGIIVVIGGLVNVLVSPRNEANFSIFSATCLIAAICIGVGIAIWDISNEKKQ